MIEIQDLWKSFQGHLVLKGLNLKVKRGETLVILGRSGVGKSVLLKHIIGIIEADKGDIKVNGRSISTLRGKARYEIIRQMGMLFQGAALFDSMTIEDNTAFFLKEHGNLETGKKYTKHEIRDLVDEALWMVGLEGTQKKMPSDLSGGMRKRAGLARLIVYRPKCFLYDEPTTGLDPMTAMLINDLILKIQEELQATSIAVTHDIVSALYIADRLALHKDGSIPYIDEPIPFFEIDDPMIAFLKKTLSQDPRTLRKKRRG